MRAYIVLLASLASSVAWGCLHTSKALPDHPSLPAAVSESSPPSKVTPPTTLDGCLYAYPVKEAEDKLGQQNRGWCIFNALVENTTPKHPPLWTKWKTAPVAEQDCTDKHGELQPLDEVLQLVEPVEKLATQHYLTGTHDPGFGLNLKGPGNHGKGDAILSAIHFNPAVAHDICAFRENGRLSLSDALSRKLYPKGGSPVSLPPLNVSSAEVIVKTSFAFATKTDSCLRSVCTNVWAMQDIGDFKDFKNWNTQVYVNTKGKCPPQASFQIDAATGGFAPTPAVALSCFYHQEIKSTDELQYLAALHVLNPSTATPAHAYVLLMGINMMVRLPGEQWGWYTFWWTGSQTEMAAYGHSPLKPTDPRWSHYVMDTGGKAMNPYLEGTLPKYGNRSGCFGCHKYAVYSLGGPGNDPSAIFQDLLQCAFAEMAGIHQSPPCKPTQPTTDYIWSLADSNAVHPAPMQVRLTNTP